MASPALLKTLTDSGIPRQTIAHARTDTAVAEATALGVPPEAVAKTIVVATPAGNVRAVVPAPRHLDLRKLGDVLCVRRSQVRLLTEDELGAQYREFELGAVPPLGGPADRVVVDARLALRDSVVFEAGTHDESARIATVDLLGAAQALVADICRD